MDSVKVFKRVGSVKHGWLHEPRLGIGAGVNHAGSENTVSPRGSLSVSRRLWGAEL